MKLAQRMNTPEGTSKISRKQMQGWIEWDESGHVRIENRAKS